MGTTTKWGLVTGQERAVKRSKVPRTSHKLSQRSGFQNLSFLNLFQVIFDFATEK